MSVKLLSPMILGILSLLSLLRTLSLGNESIRTNIIRMVQLSIIKLSWLLQVITNRHVLIAMKLFPLLFVLLLFAWSYPLQSLATGLFHNLMLRMLFSICILIEKVYMHQPCEFVDPQYPHHVSRLKRLFTVETSFSSSVSSF